MLVDDPVKRVDTMTMAWGLEARVPFLDHDFVELAAACPPEYKLAGGRQGRAQGGRTSTGAPRGHRPDEGLLPVPGIRHLEDEVLDLVRDTLGAQAAHDRAIFRDEPVAALLADPNTTRTTLGSNELWQVAMLELWLQSF